QGGERGATMSVTAFEHPLAGYIRPSAKSTANCPGCGNGILAQSILRAIEELGLTLDDFVFVSGIGCAAWIPSPTFYADVLHTTHGRPIAFGIGVKAALPNKRVMIISGDGDLTAIGGNHLIHAARRNIAMTVFCVNNGIYGMTGGQVAPTTPLGLTTVTTPFGNAENPFDISELVKGAGASFVARWTTYHPRQLVKTAKKAIQKKGFAFVEVLSQCPVEFGRKTGIGNAVQMLEWYKTKSVSVTRAKDMSPKELADRIVVGELVDIEKPELMETLAKIREKAMAS
ncbi:MAG TPA: thiamine pyrophosphate-dependent enzyme, partial [Candidatus Acidoferrum sp.]|nr:thiamine pyrophosphate-dependent enzyme [Candidatus Acidoferrum sp.]